jgi:hypothetical protein
MPIRSGHVSLDTQDLAVDELRDLVQDAHISFLLGAGASSPMFRLLGDVENILTALDTADATEATTQFARASVYAGFFQSVVLKNRELLEGTAAASQLLATYEAFLQTINRMLIRRRSSILNKQVNFFTTNIDLAIEVASEALQLELNDGFSGRFTRRFNTSNFGSVLSRRSLQYDNLSEIPTFNLLKLHGSVSWATREIELATGELQREIVFDDRIANVLRTERALSDSTVELAQLTSETTADSLLETEQELTVIAALEGFLGAYSELAVVNPTKAKFQQTVLNQNYYDLLRIFTNELEKENAVLFVIGFSCRDEHIRQLMVRAARANPTLQVIVFAYSPDSAKEIGAVFESEPITNGNIRLVSPPPAEEGGMQSRYDLETITNEFFGKVAPGSTPQQPQTVEVKVSVQDPLVATGD